MKSKKILAVIISVAVVLVVAIAGTLLWFYSPGIHTLFGYTHVDISETGYIVNNSSDEVISEVSFTMKGTLKHYHSGTGVSETNENFHLEVTGFPSISGDIAYIVDTENVLLLTAAKPGLDTDEKGEASAVREAKYEIYIEKDTSDFAGCMIYGLEDSDTTYYFFQNGNRTEALNQITEISNSAHNE